MILLILAVAASTLAGMAGIRHLESSLTEFAEQDAQRLITVTHIRRLFRSEVVLTSELADLPADSKQREVLLGRRDALREDRAVLLDRLRTLGVLGQDEALGSLRQDHERMARHGASAAI